MSARRTHNRWTVPMLCRAGELREAGLSYTAISKVLNLDMGTNLTQQGVHKALDKYLDLPKDYRTGVKDRKPA